MGKQERGKELLSLQGLGGGKALIVFPPHETNDHRTVTEPSKHQEDGSHNATTR